MKDLKVIKAKQLSPEAAELKAKVLELIPRIESGEIHAIYAVLVTVDPSIEDDDEAFEAFEEGYNYDEGGVYAGLMSMAKDVLESWEEDFRPDRGND